MARNGTAGEPSGRIRRWACDPHAPTMPPGYKIPGLTECCQVMSSLTLHDFDPLATHPFTNSSGLAPQPLTPSQYPYPVPSPPRNAIISPSSFPPIQSPQPRRPSHSKSSSGKTKPIFVPFRQDCSSPDLGDILSKKKSPSSFDSKLSSSPGKSA